MNEIAAPDPALIDQLARAVVKAKTSLDFLREVEPVLGWNVVSRRLERGPQVSVSRGDFGEVLTAQWLEERDLVVTPVQKLRFQILPGQTQPGVDVVAVELEADAITRLHLIEAKLRTTRNVSAACDAYRQHNDRSLGDLDSLLIWILERLYETGDPLFTPLAVHLRSRAEEPDDCHHISLVYEAECWSDRSLERLNDIAGDVPDVRIRVMRIVGLRTMIHSVFDAIGVGVLDDPEDLADADD